MKKTSIRRDMYLFLKSPDYGRFNDLSTRERIIVLLKVLIFTHLGIVSVNMPVLLLQKLEVISQIPMKTDLILNNIQTNFINYKPYFILSTIFIVPLLEEISYREVL